eukprot:13323024-Alexandrium_andersonii.AAC.1
MHPQAHCSSVLHGPPFGKWITRAQVCLQSPPVWRTGDRIGGGPVGVAVGHVQAAEYVIICLHCSGPIALAGKPERE